MTRLPDDDAEPRRLRVANELLIFGPVPSTIATHLGIPVDVVTAEINAIRQEYGDAENMVTGAWVGQLDALEAAIREAMADQTPQWRTDAENGYAAFASCERDSREKAPDVARQ